MSPAISNGRRVESTELVLLLKQVCSTHDYQTLKQVRCRLELGRNKDDLSLRPGRVISFHFLSKCWTNVETSVSASLTLAVLECLSLALALLLTSFQFQADFKLRQVSSWWSNAVQCLLRWSLRFLLIVWFELACIICLRPMTTHRFDWANKLPRLSINTYHHHQCSWSSPSSS